MLQPPTGQQTCLVRRTLPDLMSRWAMRWLCRYDRPRATSSTMSLLHQALAASAKGKADRDSNHWQCHGCTAARTGRAALRLLLDNGRRMGLAQAGVQAQAGGGGRARAGPHPSGQASCPARRASWTLPPSISSHTSMVLPGATQAPCTHVPTRQRPCFLVRRQR